MPFAAEIHLSTIRFRLVRMCRLPLNWLNPSELRGTRGTNKMGIQPAGSKEERCHHTRRHAGTQARRHRDAGTQAGRQAGGQARRHAGTQARRARRARRHAGTQARRHADRHARTRNHTRIHRGMDSINELLQVGC